MEEINDYGIAEKLKEEVEKSFAGQPIAIVRNGSRTDSISIVEKTEQADVLEDDRLYEIHAPDKHGEFDDFIICKTEKNQQINVKEEKFGDEEYYDEARKNATPDDIERKETLDDRDNEQGFIHSRSNLIPKYVIRVWKKSVELIANRPSRAPKPGTPVYPYGTAQRQFLEKTKAKLKEFGQYCGQKFYREILDFSISATHTLVLAETKSGKSTFLNILTKEFAIPSDEQILQIDLTGETVNQSMAVSFDLEKECEKYKRELIKLSILDDINFFASPVTLEVVLDKLGVFNNSNFWKTNVSNLLNTEFTEAFCENLPSDKFTDIDDESIIKEAVVQSLNDLKDTEKPYIDSIYAEKGQKAFIKKLEIKLLNENWVGNIADLVIKGLKVFKGNKDINAAEIVDLCFPESENKRFIILHNGSSDENFDPKIAELKQQLFMKDLFWIMAEKLANPNTGKVRTLLILDEAKLVFPSEDVSDTEKETIRHCREILDHFGRKKSLGFLVASQKYDQIDSKILARLEAHDLFVGFGMPQSYQKRVKERCSKESFEEYGTLTEPVAPGKKLEKFEFFGLGSFSPLNPNGRGVLLEFKVEDYV